MIQEAYVIIPICRCFYYFFLTVPSYAGRVLSEVDDKSLHGKGDLIYEGQRKNVCRRTARVNY